MHKSFSPLFRPNTPSSFLKVGRRHLCKRVTVIERSLRSGPYVMGADFSAVDLYLYTLCRWFPDQDLDISQWPLLHNHYQKLAVNRAVQTALANEGLG
ncbi:glutathione binding-like protein [Ruegeria arenilitoris]|uniref:glutathione binding-like protein n=1 Tax=Ruegeria arenilitoris TaxID=1173585 RepID=UPI0014818DDB